MLYEMNKFSSQFFAPIVIILGAFGNLSGIIVISQKKLKEIGPQSIFICMFALDCIYFPLIFHPYMAYMFNMNVTNMSSIACKSYWYARYSMAFISPMMNVYISVERFISITLPARKLYLQKNIVQNIYIAAIVLANMLLAIDVALFFDIVEVNITTTNQTTSQIHYCDFINIYSQEVSGYIDLVSRVILPASLMIIISFLIVGSIFKSRVRMANMTSNQINNATLRKDIRFSVVIVGLNIFYILFSLPVSIVVLMTNYTENEYYVLFSYLFFLAYSSNFYLMLSLNKIFRQEFLLKFFGIIGNDINSRPRIAEQQRPVINSALRQADEPIANIKKKGRERVNQNRK
jgi:hypothetical protein